MITTNYFLKTGEYKNLKNADMKITREVEKGNLIKLKNGLYETNPNIDGIFFANIIYGPSYVSFDTALAFYDMIPERVYGYSSATFRKKKKKVFVNHFGHYEYQDVPEEVFSIGIDLVVDGDYSVQIATREKALCDKLYTLSPIKNYNEMEIMLYSDLRIDEDDIKSLDYNLICDIEKYYHSTNVTLFKKYLRRLQDE